MTDLKMWSSSVFSLRYQRLAVLEHNSSDCLEHRNNRTNAMEAIKANGKVNKSIKDDINDLSQI